MLKNKILKCDDDDDHNDGDVDTKPAFWPTWAHKKHSLSFYQQASTRLSVKPENYNCKGMNLRLNKQSLI